MKYPKYTIYEKLYKNYFKKGVDYLIDLGNVEKGDKVLDICGGNGRLSKTLLTKTTDVSYLDQELDMIPDDLEKNGIAVYNTSVQDFIESCQYKYNKVFCQQAINYWFLKVDIKKFASIIEKNGLFIFNTFNKKPSKCPTIKEYSIDNIKYIEISYLVDHVVNHIQISEGYEPHFTQFDYIDEKTFESILTQFFDLNIITTKNTSIYVCRKK